MCLCVCVAGGGGGRGDDCGIGEHRDWSQEACVHHPGTICRGAVGIEVEVKFLDLLANVSFTLDSIEFECSAGPVAVSETNFAFGMY